MTMNAKRLLAPHGAALMAALVPTLALAHPAAPHVHGVVGGLAHPFAGLDHLVAMVAVGFWAALQARRGRLDLVLGPAAFVALLAAGAAIGVSGGAAAWVEPMIAASLLAAGLLIATRTRLPALAGLPLIGLFAFAHGAAHAPAIDGAGALVGLMLGTAALHAIGIVAGLFVRQRATPAWPRWVGGAVAVAGLAAGATTAWAALATGTLA
jgi:urease accessory protein